ncbi:MAG: hypothetical protein H7263_07745, partial [Candidatus Sericytochromatia bacterium]|nr:hypothetical protein [Candidatus Sericytochromatia bacterium]
IIEDYKHNEEIEKSDPLNIINDETFILSNLKEKYLQKVKERSESSVVNTDLSDSKTLNDKYIKRLNNNT